MRDSIVKFAYSTIVIVACGAFEELLGSVMNVGFPFLLAATVSIAIDRSARMMLMFALAAGAMEDSLCALPSAVSVWSFLAIGSSIRWGIAPYVIACAAFPVYQILLWLLVPDIEGSVFTRLPLSLGIGSITFFAVHWVLRVLGRKVALDEH